MSWMTSQEEQLVLEVLRHSEFQDTILEMIVVGTRRTIDEQKIYPDQASRPSQSHFFKTIGRKQ